jgi:hypothetical protein
MIMCTKRATDTLVATIPAYRNPDRKSQNLWNVERF